MSIKIIYSTEYSAEIRLSVEAFDFELHQCIQQKFHVIFRFSRCFSSFSFQRLTKDARRDHLCNRKDCGVVGIHELSRIFDKILIILGNHRLIFDDFYITRKSAKDLFKMTSLATFHS